MNKPKPNLDSRQEQLEQLKELGLRLHQVRIEKGISIEVIAQKTNIQFRLLKAIEAGNLEELPEPVYIQGLLKQFANSLGLNGDEFANAFPTQVSSQQRKSTLQLPRVQLRPLHLYVVYVLLVVVSVQGLSNLLRRTAPQESTIEQPQIVIVDESPSEEATQAQDVEQTSSSEQKPAKPAKPVIVSMQLRDECWLRVEVDGKTQFEGTLPAGTQRTWTAEEQVTILAGNAGGVVVAFNDQKAEQLGSPGQVQEVTYQAPPISSQ